MQSMRGRNYSLGRKMAEYLNHVFFMLVRQELRKTIRQQMMFNTYTKWHDFQSFNFQTGEEGRKKKKGRKILTTWFHNPSRLCQKAFWGPWETKKWLKTFLRLSLYSYQVTNNTKTHRFIFKLFREQLEKILFF